MAGLPTIGADNLVDTGLDNSLQAADDLLSGFLKDHESNPYSSFPAHLAWVKDKIAGRYKRDDAVTTAFDSGNLAKTTAEMAKTHNDELAAKMQAGITTLATSLPLEEGTALAEGVRDQLASGVTPQPEPAPDAEPDSDADDSTKPGGYEKTKGFEGEPMAPWSNEGAVLAKPGTGSFEGEPTQPWSTHETMITDGVKVASQSLGVGGGDSLMSQARQLINNPTLHNANNFYMALPDSEFVKVRQAMVDLANHPPEAAAKIALEKPAPEHVFASMLLAALFPSKAGAYMAIPYQYGLQRQAIAQQWENQAAAQRFNQWKTGLASLGDLASAADRHDQMVATYQQHIGDQTVGLLKNQEDNATRLAVTEATNNQRANTANLGAIGKLQKIVTGSGDLADRQSAWEGLAVLEAQAYGAPVTPYPTEMGSYEQLRSAKGDEAAAGAGLKRQKISESEAIVQIKQMLAGSKVKVDDATIKHLGRLDAQGDRRLDLQEIRDAATFLKWQDDNDLKRHWNEARITVDQFNSVKGMAVTLGNSIKAIDASIAKLPPLPKPGSPGYDAAKRQLEQMQSDRAGMVETYNTLRNRLMVAAEKLSSQPQEPDMRPGSTPGQQNNSLPNSMQGPGLENQPQLSPVRSQVLKTATDVLGSTKYVWGGTDLKKGVDCSGLVIAAFQKAGVDLTNGGKKRPTSQTMWQELPAVSREGLKPGDLVFFRNNGKISHVAIYLGGDMVVESPSTGRKVSLTELARKSKPAGYRRVPGAD